MIINQSAMLNITKQQESFYTKHLKIEDRINFIYHMGYTWKNKIIFVCSVFTLVLLSVIYFTSSEYICIVLILILLVWIYGYFLTDSIVITQSNVYIYRVIYNKLVAKIDLNSIFEVEHYQRNNRLAISLYDGTNKSYNIRLNKEAFTIIESMIAIHKEEARFDLEEQFKILQN